MSRKILRGAVVVGTLVLTAGACGGDDAGGGATGGGATGGGEADLLTSGTAFNPTTVTVSAGGDSITITNEDGFDHTFTLEDESADETLPAGETVTVDVSIEEDTGFVCTIHPSMTGTLTVG